MSFWMVVKPRAMSSGLTASKFSIGVMRTRHPPVASRGLFCMRQVSV